MKTTASSNKRTQTNYFAIRISIAFWFICLTFINISKLSAQTNEQFEQNNSILSTSSENKSSSLFNAFETIALEGNVYLKWYVIDKNNSKTYLIERSEDGIAFETKGAIKVNGGKYNVEILNCYVDKAPLTGFSYYRIAACSDYGMKEYSNINTVYLEPTNPQLPTKPELIFVNNTRITKE